MTQEALAQSQKYLNALMHAGMGLWELDIASKMLSWDEGFRKLYQLKEGEYSCPVEQWLQRIHPEDRIQMIKNSEKVLSGAEIDVDFKYRVITNSNEIKHIRVMGYKTQDNAGITKLVGLHRDVTSEVIMEQELIKSRDFTDNILNVISDPIFVKNEKHELIYVNTEYEKMVGKNKTELVGKTDYDFSAKEQADAWHNKEVEVFKNNRSKEYEELFIDAQGLAHNILIKKIPFKVSHDEKILVGVIRDITEIKNIQHSLVEQSKMASLGEMAAEIAHEVNNPLMIIQGKSQILLSKISSKNVDMANCKKDLEQIETNCIRIDKIIKSLKSVSRKADLDPFEVVSLLGLVNQAFEISIERFSKKNINLIVSCNEKIELNSKISCRPSEVVQVLVNLLNNSYDAIHNQENGWAKINVTLKKNFYLIEITDSGPEILPEIAQKMMEPFFTTKSSGKGTGLGLSVSRQIVLNHGGELLYDRTNPNTCFTFTLPKS